mgnify:CR=1 FL=1
MNQSDWLQEGSGRGMHSVDALSSDYQFASLVDFMGKM